MMNEKEQKLFAELRKKVAAYICEDLKEDYGHKSHEGTWELLVGFPNYFKDETATAKPDFYQVTLHCYVLGPGRHYDWNGSSFMEALEKCKSDVDCWVAEKNTAETP